MAIRKVFDVTFVTENDPQTVLDPMTTQEGTIGKVNNIGQSANFVTNVTELKQIIDNFLTEQISPTDPSNPPKPVLSIKVMRKNLYIPDTNT